MSPPICVAGGNKQHLTYPVNAGVFTDVREARPTGSFNGGNYLRDIVFVPAGSTETTPIHIIEIRSDLAAKSITLTWEGDGPLFQVEKATDITGTFQPLGAAQSARVFSDANALQNGSRAFYRVRVATQP